MFSKQVESWNCDNKNKKLVEVKNMWKESLKIICIT